MPLFCAIAPQAIKPAPSGGGEDAGYLRWRTLLGLSPPLMLAYSGRSENQHFSFTFQTERPASLFVRHQCFGVFRDIGPRNADLGELIVAHV